MEDILSIHLDREKEATSGRQIPSDMEYLCKNLL